jgi:hypothetical protein
MVAEPEETPVTTPVAEPTVAFVTLLLDQVPPVVEFASVVKPPTHIAVSPEMEPVAALTVTVVVLVQPPE